MIEFTIPGSLCDLNTYIRAERTNRFIAAKIKKEETERVYWELKRQKTAKIEKITLMEIHWYTKDLKKDSDNVTFAQKFILDGMVQAGIIPNDSRRYTGVTTHHMFVDKINPRITVSIE